MGIEAIFISNLIASALTLVLLLPTIAKSFRPKFHSVLYKRLLKFGLPYLPAGLAVMLVQVIDVPILGYLTDVDTVGIYKANYKLGIFMMLFVSMFQYAWQPFFLNNAKEENAKEIFSKVLTYFTVIGSLLVIFLSLFKILERCSDCTNYSSWLLFQWIVCCILSGNLYRREKHFCTNCYRSGSACKYCC
jgi:O-antigen/teichoic acid export membrane protein